VERFSTNDTVRVLTELGEYLRQTELHDAIPNRVDPDLLVSTTNSFPVLVLVLFLFLLTLAL